MTGFADPTTLTPVEIETGKTFAPKFNADGLVIAIAVETYSHQVLMTAYMNEEALKATIDTGYAHYYSRSRQSLWKKGESSGELQEVVEIRTDCDQDAILLVVRQTGLGAACHTGRKTCFYRKLENEEGELSLVDAGEPQLFNPDKIYSP